MASTAVGRRWCAKGRIGLLGLTLTLSCSADSYDAPAVPPPDLPGRCGTYANLTVALRSAIEGGLFDPVGRQIKIQLMDNGQYRVLMDSLIKIVHQAPLPEFFAGLRELAEGEGVRIFTPTLFKVIDYVTGNSEIIPGEHYELTNVAESVFRYCDPRADFATLRRLLLFELPCRECADGTELFASRFLRTASELVADPQFGALLEVLEVDHQGETAYGKEGFYLLVDLALRNLAAPTFDWDYVRGLFEDFLGTRLTGQAAQRFTELLDMGAVIVDPNVGVLSDLQIFFGCLHRHDPNHALPELIYDFAVLEPTQTGDILSSAALAVETSGGRKVVSYVARVFGILERDSRLANNTLYSLAPLLGEDSSRETLPALAAMQGRGVAQELLTGLDRLVTECRWGM